MSQRIKQEHGLTSSRAEPFRRRPGPAVPGTQAGREPSPLQRRQGRAALSTAGSGPASPRLHPSCGQSQPFPSAQRDGGGGTAGSHPDGSRKGLTQAAPESRGQPDSEPGAPASSQGQPRPPSSAKAGAVASGPPELWFLLLGPPLSVETPLLPKGAAPLHSPCSWGKALSRRGVGSGVKGGVTRPGPLLTVPVSRTSSLPAPRLGQHACKAETKTVPTAQCRWVGEASEQVRSVSGTRISQGRACFHSTFKGRKQRGARTAQALESDSEDWGQSPSPLGVGDPPGHLQAAGA